jgi:hypothetical protein
VIAVWSQYSGTSYDIYANRYAADAGWGTASLIETDDDPAFDPVITIDPDGNAIAVWQRVGATDSSVWANRFE